MIYAWGLLPAGRLFRAGLALLILGSICLPVLQQISLRNRYSLDDSTIRLVGSTNKNLVKKFSYDSQNAQWQFNKDGIQQDNSTLPGGAGALAALKAQVGGAGNKDKSLYSVNLPSDGTKGITYFDNNTNLSFSMVPEFKVSPGQDKNGQLVYPFQDGGKLIYSAKNNGMKEDIVLSHNIGDSLHFSYKLNLPSTLEAKIQDDGSVGIFSADPALFGDISYGDNTDQVKIESARQHATKSHLLFALPAPVIKQSTGPGKRPMATGRAVFVLDGSSLEVRATGLSQLTYPITVDPSVVITSSADFTTGNNEGNIDYPAGQINRGALTGGSASAGWSNALTGASFTTARYLHSTVVYNGYLYILGGNGASAMNDVQYAPINANGTIGTWNPTTSFTNPRNSQTAVAYNGYLYVLGGYNVVSLNDVQYAPIDAATGTVGTWIPTTSFNTARQYHTSVVYNGYVYVIGGFGSPDLNDIEYAPLNADGSVGTWASTTSFISARRFHTSVVYNGFLYVIGGYVAAVAQNDVQYAPLKADGTVGTWTVTTSFITARYNHTSVVYNGYLYVMGGFGAATMNDTQYAPINANGTVGTWTVTTSFATARWRHTSVVYNGYLYVIGGLGGAALNDVQYAKIDPPAVTKSYVTSANSPATARAWSAGVAYNGYLYMLGGCTVVSADTCSTTSTLVSFAPINADGTLGTWANTANALPAARGMGSAVAYEGRLYYIAGRLTSTTIVPTVYYTTISTTTGNTTAVWTAVTTPTGLTATYGHASAIYNGNLYIIGGCTTASGACVAYQNSVQSAVLNPAGGFAVNPSCANNFCPLTTFATARWGLAAAVSGNILYINGGTHAASDTLCNGTASTNCSDVQYATISATGTLSAWAPTTSAPTAAYGRAFYQSAGYLYVSSGKTATATFLNTVSYAKLTTAGTIASDAGCGTAWCSTQTATVARGGSAYAAYNGYLYLASGQTANTTVTAAVYLAGINNGGAGVVGAWTLNPTASFTTPRYSHTSVAYNGYLYILGGFGGSGTMNDVQYAPINANGTIGTWNPTASFTTGRYGHTSVAYNGYLYILGGNGASAMNDVQYAPINAADGSVGTWTATTSFTTGRDEHTSVAYNGYLYVIGGTITGGTFQNDVQYAPINANGTIGTWTATTSFTTARHVHTSVAYNGYLYVIGGNSSGGYLNDVQYTSLSVIPRIGQYSKLIDLGVGGYVISSITYNGNLPSGLGAISYKVADSTGVLGASQQASAISGGPIGCNVLATTRYVMLSVLLDGSQNGVFPDSASTYENVSDLTVNYGSSPRPSPNLRLHHGKFFQNELLQPLDTCGP